MPPEFAHVGILVHSIEKAAAALERAWGYRFTPIGRYRTDRYVDESDRCQHRHDARFVMSYNGSPRIELLEVTGTGSHGPQHVGVHHFAVGGFENLEGERARIAALGNEIDAENTDELGQLLLFFTRIGGVPFELVSRLPGPLTADDGSDLPLDPNTGRPSLLLVANESSYQEKE